MSSIILEALERPPSDAVAVCDDSRSISYATLREAVRSEAHRLQAAGVQRCALLADNSVAWIIADLALLDAGILNTPLPPWFTPQQAQHVLDDAGLDAVLTDEPQAFIERHPSFQLLGATPVSRLTLLKRARADRRGELPHSIVKVTYTSGSTGAPKGVCLSSAALEHVAHSAASAAPAGARRHLCIMPLATLLENVAGVYASLLLGGVCLAPATRTTGMNYGALDPAALVHAVSRAEAHTLILVPELLRVLIAAAQQGWRPPASLRFIAVGGAVVAPSLLEQAEQLGLPVFQGYGLSECASVVCLNTPEAARRGSVGKPLPHARVRIDERGQIFVSGACMSGYLGAERAAPREIATGDLGRIDADGYVYVHGRSKNLFITSLGRNVSPEWVEAELMREPEIARAVVFGEARPYPVALLTPFGQATPADVARAIAAANARLPNYAQVRRWSALDEPLTFASGLLTANGRPRRELIAQRYGATIDQIYAAALAS